MTAPVYWNPNSLEVSAAEHCNLTCAGCSHLSPVMANATRLRKMLRAI